MLVETEPCRVGAGLLPLRSDTDRADMLPDNLRGLVPAVATRPLSTLLGRDGIDSPKAVVRIAPPIGGSLLDDGDRGCELAWKGDLPLGDVSRRSAAGETGREFIDLDDLTPRLPKPDKFALEARELTALRRASFLSRLLDFVPNNETLLEGVSDPGFLEDAENVLLVSFVVFIFKLLWI